jgi:hypothetical protein
MGKPLIDILFPPEEDTPKGWGGRRDNRKRRPDDKRGGRRIPGPGTRLGRPRKDKAMKLIITLDSSKSDMALSGFPLVGEQIIDGALAEFNADGTETCEIDLDERTDTTAAQEQFLDTSPAVIRYKIV